MAIIFVLNGAGIFKSPKPAGSGKEARIGIQVGIMENSVKHCGVENAAMKFIATSDNFAITNGNQ